MIKEKRYNKPKFKYETIRMNKTLDDDYDYDEVRGAHGKKPKLARLNKTKLSKEDMDDLFLDE